jgi:hypothetical protein
MRQARNALDDGRFAGWSAEVRARRAAGPPEPTAEG